MRNSERPRTCTKPTMGFSVRAISSASPRTRGSTAEKSPVCTSRAASAMASSRESEDGAGPPVRSQSASSGNEAEPERRTELKPAISAASAPACSAPANASSSEASRRHSAGSSGRCGATAGECRPATAREWRPPAAGLANNRAESNGPRARRSAEVIVTSFGALRRAGFGPTIPPAQVPELALARAPRRCGRDIADVPRTSFGGVDAERLDPAVQIPPVHL